MKKYCFFLTTLLMGFSLSLFAQDDSEDSDKPELSISGSVDAYFRQNLTADNVYDTDGDGVADATTAPGSSFANLPGFSLGMANVVASMDGKRSGFVADLVYGPRGRDAVFGSIGNGSNEIVNQLYAYYNVSDGLTFTIGNFNTFLGYEVISPTGNFNYSTSYLFSYGPFSHTGIKADISLSDNMSLMLGVFNPTDVTEFNPTDSYTFGAQLGYEGDNGGTWLNLVYGDQDGSEDLSGTGEALFQIDLTTGYDVSESTYLGFNASYQDVDGSGFFGVAGYVQNSFSESFALGLRGEYFSETEGGAGAIGAYDENGDANVFALTLSGNYKVDNLTIIPELRFDSASEDAFLDSDAAETGSLASFVLGAVYSF